MHNWADSKCIIITEGTICLNLIHKTISSLSSKIVLVQYGENIWFWVVALLNYWVRQKPIQSKPISWWLFDLNHNVKVLYKDSLCLFYSFNMKSRHSYFFGSFQIIGNSDHKQPTLKLSFTCRYFQHGTPGLVADCLSACRLSQSTVISCKLQSEHIKQNV